MCFTVRKLNIILSLLLVVVMDMSGSKNQLREESIDFAIDVSDICDDIKGYGKRKRRVFLLVRQGKQGDILSL